MTRKVSLLQKTALPKSVLFATVAQECVRRFKNTSRDLHENHINSIIDEYTQDLREGGFSPPWIQTAITAGLNSYMKMVELELNGKGYINRPEASTRGTRIYKKLCGKSDWFKIVPKKRKAPPPPPILATPCPKN